MYKITDIHPEDAYYGLRDKYIGMIGVFIADESQCNDLVGFQSGDFIIENDMHRIYFLAIKVELV